MSVIEGLRLPDLVLLLPMPALTVLRSAPGRALLRDYWGRRFEGEVARAWQAAREDNQDQERFGAAALSALIGDSAAAEALDLLVRDGVPGAAEGPEALCRSWVARTVRLRYFAPGTRGCHFPAVRDWGAVDRWLDAGGLDLPPPLSGTRLPLLLERSRPSGPCDAATFRAPLPPELPYGCTDPDRLALVGAREPQSPARPTTAGLPRVGLPAPQNGAGPTAGEQPPLESLCLAVLRRAGTIRRHPGLTAALGAWAAAALRPLQRTLLQLWGRLPLRSARGDRPLGWELRLRLGLLGASFADFQRAELDGRYGSALRHLRRVQDQYERLRPHRAPDSAVQELLDGHRTSAAESLAHALAVAGRLSPADATTLAGPIGRLATESDAQRTLAAGLLRQLERALLSGDATYYRIDPRAWLATGRPRQILPFQGVLKELRALDAARRMLEELRWPVAELDRLAGPIGAAAEHLGVRLERQIGPHVLNALEAAGLIARAPAERVAMLRLADSMTELVRTRWELRFADVRDLLARDALQLPDATLRDLLRGDLLTRFDRAAALALPGVYRRGELYVKGLQRLSSPLFGTPAGRLILQVALGPWLLAYLSLAGVELVWHLAAPDVPMPPWTDAAVLLPLTVLFSLTATTRLGRHVVRGLWRGAVRTWGFLLGPELSRLLRRFRHRIRYWGPAAWLLDLRPVRALLDRLLAPLAVGLIPLLPLLPPLWLATPEHLDGALWIAVPSIAFALGTLLRDTPGGRLWLDDLVAGWQRFWTHLRHEGLAALVAAVMGFFAAQTRRLAEALNRVRRLLDRRLDEPWLSAALKTLAAPVWGAIEAVIQFYAVVLVEPQTNPIKHFPVVTLGHKLLLPFLPAIASGLGGLLSPFLPAAIALPFVALNVFLIPGLFGFLFWELKENRKLYAANRRAAVPPARLGTHGDTVSALLSRGFHGGTLPKAFDRLRQTLERQATTGDGDAPALRRAARALADIASTLRRFALQDLGLPLREGCATSTIGLREIEVGVPRLSTQAAELEARLRLPDTETPLVVRIRLAMEESGLRCEARLSGPLDELPPGCRERIGEALDWLAQRCGAKSPVVAID